MSAAPVSTATTDRGTLELVLENARRSKGSFLVISGITIVLSALFIATASIGINVYNRCQNFGGNDPSGLNVFFIIMLVIAILAFLAAIIALILYFQYNKNLPLTELFP